MSLACLSLGMAILVTGCSGAQHDWLNGPSAQSATLPAVVLDSTIESPRLSAPLAADALPSASDNVPVKIDAQLEALPSELRPNVSPRQWTHIVLHHTATESADVETIDDNHRQRVDDAGRPWLGIGYHFVIGNGQGMPDGLIEPTFRWQQQLHGAHAGTRLHNDSGIGICLVGDFNEHEATEQQRVALKRLVSALVTTFDIQAADIVPHRDVRPTTCPGHLFPLDEAVAAARPPAAAAAAIAAKTSAASTLE